jgi:hypothetical protein
MADQFSCATGNWISARRESMQRASPLLPRRAVPPHSRCGPLSSGLRRGKHTDRIGHCGPKASVSRQSGKPWTALDTGNIVLTPGRTAAEKPCKTGSVGWPGGFTEGSRHGLESSCTTARDLQLQHALPLLVRGPRADDHGPWMVHDDTMVSN